VLVPGPVVEAQLAVDAASVTGQPLRTLLRSGLPPAPTPARMSQEAAADAPSPLYRPLLYGLGAKVAFNGLILFYAGDVYHGFAPMVLVDPLVTAFAVHLGDDERGSFPLTMLASYVSLYLATHIAYGYDLSAGSFEEGASESPLWISMGVQLGVTLLIERLTGEAAAERRRR
jgi:hypothetical protein